MTKEEYDAIMARVKKWDEWFIRAVTLYGEARSESMQGKLAVAYVMRARQEDGQLWNDILSPKQFSCWNYYPKTQSTDPNFQKMLSIDMYKDKAFRDCVVVTFQAMFGWATNPVKGADHYYVTTMLPIPTWAASMRQIATIGSHTFLSSKRG